MPNKNSLILSLLLACSTAFTSALSAEQLSIAVVADKQELDMLRANVAAFHAVSPHRVDILAVPEAEVTVEFTRWLQAGYEEVDVYLLDFYQAQQLSEHLVELNYPGADAHWDSAIAAHQLDDKLYALPYYMDVQVLFYRADLLGSAQSVPASWGQLATISEQLLRLERSFSNSNLEAYAFAADTDAQLGANLLEWTSGQGDGGGLSFDADGNARIFSLSNIKALNQASGWLGTISPDYLLELSFAATRDLMRTGNLLFLRDWFSQYPEYNQGALRGLVAWAPLPGEQRSAASVFGRSLAVSRYSDQQAAAAELISFLSSSSVQSSNLLQYGKLPTWTSLYLDAQLTQRIPNLRDLIEVLRGGSMAWPADNFREQLPEAMELMGAASRSVLTKKASAQGALSDLEVRLNELLAAAAEQPEEQQ